MNSPTKKSKQKTSIEKLPDINQKAYQLEENSSWDKIRKEAENLTLSDLNFKTQFV